MILILHLLILLFCQLVPISCTKIQDRKNTVFIESGDGRVPATPYFVLPNGLAAELASSLVFDCWLTLNDLPQGSCDLIDISEVEDVRVCANLPPRFFGLSQKWHEFSSFMPRFMLLNELDEERYGVFERHIAPLVDCRWLFGANKGDLHLACEAISSSSHVTNMFPSRRVLQTFKNKLLAFPKFIPCKWLVISHVTPPNLIDWGRVFLEERVRSMSDQEILNSNKVRCEIVKSILSIFVPLYSDDMNYVAFVDCYITKYNDLVFCERFERCVLDLRDLHFSHRNFGRRHLYDVVLARRNQLLYDAVFNGKDRAEMVKLLFNVHTLEEVGKWELPLRLEKWIVAGTNGQKIGPEQWRAIGSILQVNESFHYPDIMVLILVGYFLGHVDLCPEFLQTNNYFQAFSTSRSREMRQEFPAHILDGRFQIVCDALGIAATVDHTFKIVNRDFAMATLQSNDLFGPATILYFTEGSEKMPIMGWMEAQVCPVAPTESYRTLYKRIHRGLWKIPRQNLPAIVHRIGLESLGFVDDDNATWLLRVILGECRIYDQNERVMKIVDRLFPRVLLADDMDWIVSILSDAEGRFAGAPRFLRRLHLLSIKHFDLESLSDPKLYTVLVEYGQHSTLAFVKFFKRMEEHESFEFGLPTTHCIKGVREGLRLWLNRHFIVTFTDNWTCRIGAKRASANSRILCDNLSKEQR